MVQIIPNNEKRSFGEQVLAGVNEAVPGIQQYFQKQEQRQQMQKENESAKKIGLDLSGINDPQTRQKMFSLAVQGANQKELEKLKQSAKKEEQKEIIKHQKELQTQKDIAAKERIEIKPKAEKGPLGGLGGTALSPEESKTISNIIKQNPKASAEELEIAFNEAGIIPGRIGKILESRRRSEEHLSKVGEQHRQAMRQETLPIRTELAKKSEAASKGIQNKQQLLNLIEKGDLNDPTYAAIAESLPLNLGKRLLSNDTVEYKAGLVEEFGDLRNIFQGQTRVKEIELLENKIADIYLNDEQKKAVLSSRLNALKADIIRAEAAAELENRDDLGVLQFNAEVERIAKPRLDALFNQILDEQKSIIQNAENKKKIALDPSDPEDRKIMEQIKKEARGDKARAKEIAKKKGYIVKGSK